MSLIKFGTTTAPARKLSLVSFVGDDEMGLRIWTPSGIKSLLAQISTELEATALMVRDGMASRGSEFLTDAELRSFKTFYAETRKWLDSKPSALWGATVDRATDYQKRIADWRTYLVSRGARAVAPAPSAPTNDPLLKLPEISTGMKTVLGIGAVAAVAFGVATLASKVPGSKAST